MGTYINPYEACTDKRAKAAIISERRRFYDAKICSDGFSADGLLPGRDDPKPEVVKKELARLQAAWTVVVAEN